MIKLQNALATVLISERGAELRSFCSNEREYIWQADPEVWNSYAPITFPICGTLVNNEYILDEKRYTLSRHGFARGSVFEVESAHDSSATFLLKSSDETRAVYPYEFEFRVIYTLKSKTLTSRVEVKNLSPRTMYFSVGSHEGYFTPEGIEEYDILLSQKESLYTLNLDGAYLDGTSTLFLDDTDVIPLSYDYYKERDTLIFKDIRSKSVTLKKRDKSRALRISFEGYENLLLWTKVGAKLICIEPWNGLPDPKNTDGRLENKLSIQTVKKSETYIREHSIEILE